MIKFLVFLLTSIFVLCQLKSPVSFTTIRAMNKRKHPDDIVRAMNVPGFHPPDFVAPYNLIALDGWTFKKGLYEACELWANLEKYMGKMSRFGQNTSEMQQYIKSLYNGEGSKLLVTAFSDYEFPVSQSIGALEAAKQLAVFVKKNNLDGAVLQFVDSPAVLLQTRQMQTSLWVESFLKELRMNLPSQIIVLHCFASDLQPKFELQKSLNILNLYLDYFVIKYYNTGINDHTNAQSVFYVASNYTNTAVIELIKNGIRSNKLLVGKPSKPSDSLYPESFIDATKLSQIMVDAYTKNGWYGGYANNDMANDMQGVYLHEATRGLQKQCDASAMCM